jgi:hypothetical protein
MLISALYRGSTNVNEASCSRGVLDEPSVALGAAGAVRLPVGPAAPAAATALK